MKSYAALLVICFIIGVKCQGPIVDIPGLGSVLGDTDLSYDTNRTYYRFRGIPFAAPPIGSYRYQAPGPLQPWGDTLNGTKLPQKCPQIIFTTNSTMYDDDDDYRASDDAEDCLYLNIYTPTTSSSANLPVIVFYHGGGFVYGSGIIYDGKKFMDENVILVNPQYRLGALGFLSLHTDEIPGNAGMIDQVRALEWVKTHISAFGGNPNQITVMGESAGAASSSLLSISPLSTNLFQRYVSQSGASVGVWAIEEDPVRAATEVGRILGCPLDIPSLTVCLQTSDAMAIIAANDEFYKNDLKAGRYSASAPVVQQAGAVRFLEQDPRVILDAGTYTPKPALLGANKNEGTLPYSVVYNGFLVPNNLHNDTEYLKREFTNFMLEFFGVVDQGETIASSIEKAFMGRENMGNITAMAGGVVDYSGDMFLKAPVYELALYNSRVADTYLYAFRFEGLNSLWPFYGSPQTIPGGVCHANELILLFDIPALPLSPAEKDLSRQMVKLWSNFATSGDPNVPAVSGMPIWPKFDGSVEGSYLRLDKNSTVMQHYSNNEYFAAIDENFPWG